MYEKLLAYANEDIYPMHMPGHKRNPEFQMANPYSFDVTEVEGTDNLHHPREEIRRLMNQMKSCYGTRESYLLVNGSTCGILAALSACCKKGDFILVDRNCHRSVYHGIYLLGLNPVYLYRKVEKKTGIAMGLERKAVEKALSENPNLSCVILTSPTYEGIVSEIRQIAKSVHQREIPLIVDEAHGAHLAWGEGLMDGIPSSAMTQGADLVIESLHKTLPALTQTGVLHLCSGRIPPSLVERYLAIYETSSPSYVLMASVAQCMDWMEKNKTRAFSEYKKNLDWFREQSSLWKVLSLWDNPQKESSKLVIFTGTKELRGPELAAILREKYKIQVEMEGSWYCLAMTSPCDTREGFQRLADALSTIDKGLAEQGIKRDDGLNVLQESVPAAKVRMDSYKAMNGGQQEILLENSVGRISAEYVMVYPPGIPFLVPGEEISQSVVEMISQAKEQGLQVIGPEDDTLSVLRVCTDI